MLFQCNYKFEIPHVIIPDQTLMTCFTLEKNVGLV